MAPARNILVVDDDNDLRESLAGLLKDEGMAVDCVTDGAEALRYLRANPRPDAVLLDWNMRPMGGAQLLAALANDPATKDLRVLVVSADARLERTPSTYPVAAVLQKPIDLAQLFALLGRRWE